MAESNDLNQKVREAWDANARFWNDHMGEGNDFFNELVWPAVESLLQPGKGQRLLDVACGNGLTSRRLAAAGAEVVAFDFSDKMIISAREHTRESVEYLVLDATDEQALLQLGANSFDGALCNMALMDMADIRPLMRSLAVLLRPGGRFVFSILHPCFNNPSTVLTGELEDRNGTLVTTYSVKISRYLTPFTQPGLAMEGQPLPQLYFHRPLGILLGSAFEAGLVLEALEEWAFPPDNRQDGFSLSWSGKFSEIPPVLVARLVPKTAG